VLRPGVWPVAVGHLSERPLGCIDRTLAGDEDAERLAGPHEEDLLILEEHFVGGELLRGARLVELVADATVELRAREVVVSLGVVAGDARGLDEALLRDEARAVVTATVRSTSRCVFSETST
jgi:hypothetical protein